MSCIFIIPISYKKCNNQSKTKRQKGPNNIADITKHLRLANIFLIFLKYIIKRLDKSDNKVYYNIAVKIQAINIAG